MLETIAWTCRAVASDPRLRILYLLRQDGELASCEIARAAGLTRSAASKHLGRLSGSALLGLRRSGRYVYYQFPDGRRGGFGAAVGHLVRRACLNVRGATRGWRKGTILHLAPGTAGALGAPAARALDVVFDAASAFGNVRRLLILRLLRREGPRSLAAVGGALRMSGWACDRQLGKLRRRGYVAHGAGGLWQLADGSPTPFHSELLGAVGKHLG